MNAGLVEAAIRRHVDHRENTLIPEADLLAVVALSRSNASVPASRCSTTCKSSTMGKHSRI
jgi:hypothetical protein